MRSRATVILALFLLAAGCGEGLGEGESTTRPPVSTTGPTVTGTTEPVSTTVSEPATTTTPAPWAGAGFPEAMNPEDIPWDDVGPGWLLVRYAQSTETTGSTSPEALFLIDRENTFYGVAEWDGREILDWSADGRSVLTFDGTLQVIDLVDGTEYIVPADLAAGSDDRVDARFSPTGNDIVVRTLSWEGHVRLERWAIDGALAATLADLDFATHTYGDPEFVQMGITWLYGPAGSQVAVATGDGISLLTDQGALIRQLDAPGLGCTLSRWWGEGSVLAACYDPDWAASECWYRGPMPDGRSLWSVPVDGSPATRLTPQPVCTAGPAEAAAPYEDGLLAGSSVAACTGHCCECGGNLELITGSTITTWTGYPGSLPCSPSLIAARGDRVLVLDTVYGSDPNQGAIGWLGVVFEVAADGTTQPITPVEPGWYGGVRQALTTEEAGG